MTAPTAAALARATEALEREVAAWDDAKARGYVSRALLTHPEDIRTILAALVRYNAMNQRADAMKKEEGDAHSPE